MMTSQKAYSILQVRPGAHLDQVKQAYRRLAFTMHPDLNPHLREAHKSFQRLNEAYVFILKLHENSGHGKPNSYGAHRPHNTPNKKHNSGDAEDRKAYEDAKKAYDEAQKTHGQQSKIHEKTQDPPKGHSTHTKSRRREDVLKDILNDPFAKRVFEDIYQHIEDQQHKKQSNSETNNSKPPEKTNYSFCHKREGLDRDQKARKGILGRIKGWLRKQIDDEQVLILPAGSVVPGARIRLDIQHGMDSNVRTIEITLPQDFTPEKKVRLQGLGKRLGSIRGDLYVCIAPE